MRDIIAQFGDEIRYDCHSLRIAFGRSSAAQALLDRPREALLPVVQYLESLVPPGGNKVEQSVQQAFGLLLAHLAGALGIANPEFELADRDRWIQWGHNACVQLKLA